MDENRFWIRLWHGLGVLAIAVILGGMALAPGCTQANADEFERKCKAIKEAAPSLDPAAQTLLVDRAFPHGPK